MRLQELGYQIRRARNAHGLTQAQLAAAAKITRTTLNRLENGLIEDLGIRKVNAILQQLGLVLSVQEAAPGRRPDFLRMAATTASVSFDAALTEAELRRALLTGKVPHHRRPHLLVLFNEVTPAILKGLVQQVGQWAKPGKAERNVAKLARELGIQGRQPHDR